MFSPMLFHTMIIHYKRVSNGIREIFRVRVSYFAFILLIVIVTPFTLHFLDHKLDVRINPMPNKHCNSINPCVAYGIKPVSV